MTTLGNQKNFARILIVVSAVLSLAAFGYAGTPAAADSSSSRKFGCGMYPFGVGERLRYHMDFSFINAGISEMRVIGVDSTCCVPAFHFRSRVKSNATIDLIYKVRDVVESWFAVDNLVSLRYNRNIREGSYRSRKFFDYNHETGWVAVSNENGPKDLYPFDPGSHNIISALYWVRCQDLETTSDLVIPVHDLDEQYMMKVIIHGRETVEVPAGRFSCWRIEPVIESEGLFKMAGKLEVWISDDEYRLPVLMKSKIPVGSIDGKLVEYRTGQPWIPGVSVPDDKSDSDWNW